MEHRSKISGSHASIRHLWLDTIAPCSISMGATNRDIEVVIPKRPCQKSVDDVSIQSVIVHIIPDPGHGGVDTIF